MKLSGRILSSGMQGTDVRYLHNELEELDFMIPPHERQQAIFGPGTKKVVVEFQRDFFSSASRANGVVDQETANALDMAASKYRR